MTDNERIKLTNAFGIPSPDRKAEFTEEYRRLDAQRHKKPLFPVIMRTAAAAAVVAVIIGVAAKLPKNKLDFNGADTETVHITTAIPDNDKEESTASITTAVLSTSKAGTTTSGSSNAGATTSADNKNDSKAVNTSTASGNTNAVRTTSQESRRTTVRTTSAPATSAENRRTTGRPSTSVTKAGENTIVTTTISVSIDPETDNPKEEGSYYNDMTVSPEVIYPERDNRLYASDLLLNDKSPVQGNAGVPDPWMSDNGKGESVSEMFKNSYAVVLAKVDKMVYTSIGGSPMTAEDLTIEKVFKGSLGTGDRLTVFISGGCIPAEEFISMHPDSQYIADSYNTSVYDSADSRYELKVGKTYLFFIDNGSSEFPDGAFTPHGKGQAGIFESDNNFYSSIGIRNLYFRKSETEQILR